MQDSGHQMNGFAASNSPYIVSQLVLVSTAGTSNQMEKNLMKAFDKKRITLGSYR